ncbi:hypothetical protein [Sorangium sp. So ce887]|uniref:hypothetical protein n=1 Tax=Sorangium sp. So ce887 TaxID=3133324 RepID=UPI003F5F63DC
MVELLNSRWMRVAMAMAALTTGCAAGEAGADEIDMDEAEAVEVEETSQALHGYGNSRNCGWGRDRWRRPWNRGGGFDPWGGSFSNPSWGGPWSSGIGQPFGGGYGSNFGYGGPSGNFGYGGPSGAFGNYGGGNFGYGGGCNGRW